MWWLENCSIFVLSWFEATVRVLVRPWKDVARLSNHR